MWSQVREGNPGTVHTCCLERKQGGLEGKAF